MADNRYKNGKIYRLINSVDKEEYIGSTCTSLAKRLHHHKKHAKEQETAKATRVYTHLNKIGFKNVVIVLIEEYPCNNKMELLRRERYWIEKCKSSLNHNIPSRTRQEYNTDNKDKLAETSRKYHQENKDEINKRKAEYRANNKETLLQKAAEYRRMNKDKIAEKQKLHREANKEEINAKERARRALKKQVNSA